MPIRASLVSAKIAFLVLALVPPALFAPQAARAHRGGLDSLGCHHDRIHGGYHCHRGSLAGRSFTSKTEAERAMAPAPPQPSTLLSRPGSEVGAASESDLVATAQNLLHALGYEPGVADGRLGPRTVSAIQAFQEHRHLQPDGRVSGSLLVHLSEAVVARRGR